MSAQICASEELPNGVAVGDVSATTAVLWARATATGELQFEFGTSESFDGGSTQSVLVEVTDVFVPVKAEITGLEPGTLHYYRAQNADGVTSSGRFRTAAQGVRAGFRFGVSGDWRGDLAPFPSVRNVPDRNLELFIALGDTIYADVPSPDVPLAQCMTIDDFRAKHNEVYSERAGMNTLAALRASTAILATIDDHEVTNDFAGGAPPESDSLFAGETVDYIHDSAFFKSGMQAFREFNPIREEVYGETGDPRTANKMKLYRARTYGLDAAVFMLDARTFRDEPLAGIGPSDPQPVVDDFLQKSFDASRTMLGRAQVDELKADLLAASAAGVTWKFVIVPEPIQNLGAPLASDRFEGYAAERTELLEFIVENNIANVVFIAADIHGTVVNNLFYQNGFGQPQIQTSSWEISTGSVAYAAPFGPTVFAFVNEDTVGPVAGIFQLIYALNDRKGRDDIVTLAGQLLLARYNLDPIGLDNTPVDVRLTKGGYVAVNSYGWTEFEIDAETQCLAVTTWGIDWYSREEISAATKNRTDDNAKSDDREKDVLSRMPEIVSQFIVRPENSTAFYCPSPTASEDKLFSGCGCGILFGLPLVTILPGIAAGFRRRDRA